MSLTNTGRERFINSIDLKPALSLSSNPTSNTAGPRPSSFVLHPPTPMRLAPQEIIDHVIDFIHDEPNSLCAARLVSRSWNISARVHLFRRLDLSISDIPNMANLCVGNASNSSPRASNDDPCQHSVARVRKFLSILETSVDIPHCVREVTVGNTRRIKAASTDDEIHETYTLLLSSIFSYLHRVSTLHMHELAWTHFQPSFQTCIVDLCQLPSLEHLDIWNCQFLSMACLMDFLHLSSGVRTLRLSQIQVLNLSMQRHADVPMFFGRPCEGWVQSRNRSALHSLTLDSTPLAPLLYGILATSPHSLDLSKIRSLCMSHVSDMSSVREFLYVAGTSLEELELRVTSCTFQSLTSRTYQ